MIAIERDRDTEKKYQIDRLVMKIRKIKEILSKEGQ